MADESVIEVEARLKDFISKNLKTVERNMLNFAERGEKSTSLLSKSFDKMKNAVIGLFAINKLKDFVIAATKKFAEFEKTMAEVNTIARLSKEDLAGVSSGLIEMSKRIPKSANELGAGLYQVFSAGIKDTAEAMQVLEASTKLAVAGLGDSGSTVKLVTGIYNTYKDEVRDVNQITDVLFRTVENGVTTLPELANTFGRLVPIAKAANVKIEELSGAVATLTSRGMNTDIAVTALRGAIVNLYAPTAEATKIMDKLGISGKDVNGNMKDLSSVIQQFQGLDIEIVRKLIPDVNAANAVLTLAGNFETLGKNTKSAMESGGSAVAAFETQMDTTTANIKLLSNTWDEILINIGSKAGAVISKMQKDAEEFNRIQKMLKADEFRNFLINIEEAGISLMDTFDKVTKKIKELSSTGVMSYEELINVINTSKLDSRVINELVTEYYKWVEAQKAVKDGAEDTGEKVKARNKEILEKARAILQQEEDLKKSLGQNSLNIRTTTMEIKDLNSKLKENKKAISDADKAYREAEKQLEDLRNSIKASAYEYANLGIALGESLASGVGKGMEGLKESLKAILNTSLDFIAKQILVARAAVWANTAMAGGIFNPAAIAKAVAEFAGISAAFAAAKAGVNSFARGGDFTTNGRQLIEVGDNPGGRERVHITPLSSPNYNGPSSGPAASVRGGDIVIQGNVTPAAMPMLEAAKRRSDADLVRSLERIYRDRRFDSSRLKGLVGMPA